MFICFNEGTVSKENFKCEAMISELCTRKREPRSSIQACYVDSLQLPEVSMANLAKFVSCTRKREPRSSIQACYWIAYSRWKFRWRILPNVFRNTLVINNLLISQCEVCANIKLLPES